MAEVVFQVRSADSPVTAHIAIEHNKSKSLALCQQTKSFKQCGAFEEQNKDPCRVNSKRNGNSQVEFV